MTNSFISVGYHNGEMDFSIAATVEDLSIEEMNDLRAMIVVGIGTMEDMWRRAQERRHAAHTTETWEDGRYVNNEQEG